MVIAIDGYSGCFKTRLSNDLAKRLQIPCVNTGNCYRVLTDAWIKNPDTLKVDEWILAIERCFFIDKDGTPCISGYNCQSDIRSDDVNKTIVEFSRHPSVRMLITEKVQSFAQNRNAIVEGRDIGTEVFPYARHKFFLTTKTHQEIFCWIKKQNCVTETEVEYVERHWGARWLRDFYDMTRNIAPVCPADDANIIDVSATAYEDVLEAVCSILHITVSFVVPFFNVGTALKRCVDSIRNSCSSSYEIVIVDDGSSDDSAQIAEELSTKSSDVLFIRSQHNGVSNARNIALERVRGDYIVFCDADDEMCPGGTDVLLKMFRQGISVAVGNVKKPNSPIIKANKIIDQKEAVKSFFRSDDNRLLGTVYGKAFKRKDISDVRFDPCLRIGEDALFILQCFMRAEEIALTSVFVYNHYDNPFGLIRASSASTFVDALVASEKMIRIVNGYDELVCFGAQDLWMVFLRCCTKFRDHKSREMFYEYMCAIIEKLEISFRIKSVNNYLVRNNRFSVERRDVLIGNSNRRYIVDVDGQHVPFYIRPGFVNMHIHLGDYNYSAEQVRYTSLEQFLSRRQGMRDGHSYDEAVANNISAGLAGGDAIFCYSSKKIKHSTCQIVQLIKRGAITNSCDGVFVDNAATHTSEEFLSLMSECKKYNLPIFMHISSSQEQDAAERRCYSGSLVKFLDESGCLNSLVFMVHGNYLTEEELAVIGKRHANVVICPLSNYFLSERSQLPERLDLYGIQWFVGSDSHFLTRQSSVSADAGYLIRHGYNHTNRLLENITTAPISVSLKWKHPLFRYYFINFYDNNEIMSAKTIIDMNKKPYTVNVLGLNGHRYDPNSANILD